MGLKDMQKKAPFTNGSLVRSQTHVSMMRGNAKDKTVDGTVLVEPNQILLITDTLFAGAFTPSTWWYVSFVHLDSVYWVLMTAAEAKEKFEKIRVATVSRGLRDHMRIEDDEDDG